MKESNDPGIDIQMMRILSLMMDKQEKRGDVWSNIERKCSLVDALAVFFPHTKMVSVTSQGEPLKKWLIIAQPITTPHSLVNCLDIQAR
jgi:hypothetical protein